jgi:hypothetical protein
MKINRLGCIAIYGKEGCRNFAPKLACYGLQHAGLDTVGRNKALRSYGGRVWLARRFPDLWDAYWRALP